MTRRERKERKAARLRRWASAQQDKAQANYSEAHQLAEHIPFGQPILVGHHSEKRMRRDIDRINNKMQRTIECTKKAERMHEKADNIDIQIERSIFDDDPDAIQRLEERLQELLLERESIKAYNKSCRAGKPDLSLLTEHEQHELATITRVMPEALGPKCQMPAFKLANLNGRITATKHRLERLKRKKGA